MATLQQLAWTPELARQFWNDLAGSEFLERIAFSRFAAPLLVDLAEPYLPKDGLLFDYGAGDNLFLVRELLCRGFAVAALEPNSAAAARNQDLFANPLFRGIEPETGKGRYDCVFFSEVIEHLTETEASKALRNIRYGLRDSGVLVVTTPDDENLFLASRYCPTCRMLFHPWGHVRRFTAASLEDYLACEGFVCEELRSVDFSSQLEMARRLDELQHEAREVAKQLSRCAELARASMPAAAHDVTALASRLAAAAGQAPSGDKRRQRLGAGGTLVAIVRKTGS